MSKTLENVRRLIQYGLARILPQLVHNLAADGKLPDSGVADNTLSQIVTRFRGR